MKSSVRVLIVDDEDFIRKSFVRILKRDEYEILEAGSLEEAKNVFVRENPDVVLLDVKLPDGDGIEFLERLKSSGSSAEVIIVTGYGTVEMAVEAVKKGAFDFLTKPIEPVEKLRVAVMRAVERKKSRERIAYLEDVLGKESAFSRIIGRTTEMKEVFNLIESVAPAEASILIYGESGTGKELVARAIHDLSRRKNGPFITVNCSALTETLIESELFGHEKGAFTGAITSRRGMFEEADGGTIFLDEIGDLPSSLQPKLLRVLQNGEVRRVGGSRVFHVDVRVIAATNRDLKKAMEEGSFREDLYYRLSVVTIHLPPLRERRDDIPLLANYFVKKYAEKNNKNIHGISDVAMKMLMAYRWPGNVRELENVIERAVIIEKEEEITPGSLPHELTLNFDIEQEESTDALLQLPYQKAKEVFTAAFERKYFEGLLKKTEGNVTRAAKLAGMDRSNFRKILKRIGLK